VVPTLFFSRNFFRIPSYTNSDIELLFIRYGANHLFNDEGGAGLQLDCFAILMNRSDGKRVCSFILQSKPVVNI